MGQIYVPVLLTCIIAFGIRYAIRNYTQRRVS
jgi:hypothetical protein